MQHEVEATEDGVVVRLHGAAVGGPDAARFHDALRALQADGHAHVVVDASGLTRVDPVGLGTLIGGLALMRNGGGELSVAAPPHHLHSLLLITRLRAALPCFDTVADAHAAHAARS